jgi:PBP1b-binding outer membrane lipoprotein LpoB
MKKYFFIAIIIFLLNGCALEEAINQRSPAPATQYKGAKEAAKTLKINGQEIKVEIADTPELQYQGLSFKKSLCADCGMLFIFKERSEKTFVMRNMNF